MKTGNGPDLKILHVINSLYSGGAEKLLVDAVLKYNEMGLKSDVFLLNARRSYLYDTLASEPGIDFIHSSEDKSVYHPKHIFNLTKLMSGYDIVHVHLFPSLYWAAFANLFSGKAKGKLILTEHSTNNKRRESIFYRIVDRFLYRQFTHIVAISDSAAANLQKHLGPTYKNISTINNGIDLNVIENAIPYSKNELGLKENDFLLVQVSGFRYPKDQKTVIKALTRLPNNVHLLLVGDGPQLQENIDFAENSALAGRVHFLGLRSDVPRLLKTTDIAILSSHYEGLSLSSVEGLASGKPFIATEVPGLTEVVKYAGLLFPVNDYEKLSELIHKLYSDKSFYKNTVKNCLARAKEYDISNMVNSYIKLYKKSSIDHL
jgi:glycosyltransferase involved in cell wall biosynthesis